MSQAAKAETFRALHVKGDPVILYNIWDPGSAKAVIEAGAKALATGSAPVAMAHGFADGEKMPLELACANFARIAGMTDLPVTMDLEGGYGVDTDTVAASVTQALEAGAIGVNFEDQIVGGGGLHAVDAQAKRVGAVCRAAEAFGVRAFVNARTDIFLKAKPETHSAAMLEDAIARAIAYADAGADGFFAPGLKDETLIGRLCEAVALPLNIIALPGTPPNDRLAELGVARISYGPVPYRQMVKALGDAAAEAMGG